MRKGAHFSPCRTYRYALWRIWNDSIPYALFIGLNPSTADETTDDPTVRRCINYARAWKCGGLVMTNLFAFRATEPGVMKAAVDPIGPDNDAWILKLARDAGLLVGAWGNHGAFLGRSDQMLALLPDMHCLQVNRTGQPAHPLYQRADLEPVPFVP